MFGLFKKGPSSKFLVMGHGVDVVSISRDGKLLYTGDTVKAYPKSHMEGQILEISYSTRSGSPYFVYYLSPDYYFATVGPANASTFGGPLKTEEFRSTVSQQVLVFLIQYLHYAFKIDARRDITSFSHNRAHTNVLTYVTSLKEWFAIQHNDLEVEDAAERKAAEVNSGRKRITDVIAINEPSPDAANF